MASGISGLDELRSQLTEEACVILNSVWSYRLERNSWVPTSALFHQLGRDFVLEAFGSLNGSVLYEHSGHGDLRCSLTFLGMLLTDDGKKGQKLLERLLGYIRDRLRNDPEFDKVDSEEVRAALSLTQDQFDALYYYYWESRFTGGGGGAKEKWSFGIPYYVRNELPLEEDLKAYLESDLLKDYDPYLPVRYEERSQYLAGKSKGTLRSEFWFVADADLRNLLEQDWREAQSVYGARGWKSCVILCGSILEGVLMDALNQNLPKACQEYFSLKRKPAPALHRWDLAELVDVANGLKIFPRGTIHLSHAIREFRNLVHPGRQLREHIQVTEDQASIAISLVRLCLQR